LDEELNELRMKLMEEIEGLLKILSAAGSGFFNNVKLLIEQLASWLGGLGVPQEYVGLAAMVLVYLGAIVIVLVFILLLMKLFRDRGKRQAPVAEETIAGAAVAETEIITEPTPESEPEPEPEPEH
jgi:hypothetical protein